MPDFQTFIAILTTLLVFLTGVALKYDTLAFRNYTIPIPQWAGLSFAGITFTFVVLDQLLRGFVRLEEIQRRAEEVQRRAEEEQRRAEEEQRRAEEEQRRREEDRRRVEAFARAENERLEERNRRLEEEQRRRDELARAENERLEERNRRDEERNRRDEEARERKAEAARAENARAKSAERETRRIRIETRYRTAIIRFQLDPNFQHRQQLANVLALLEEYQDTL